MEQQIPRVSVIIAVYNNKEYLPAAIESACKQDYPNLDVWVVDDCSTEKVMDSFAVYTASGILARQLSERSDEVDVYRDNYVVTGGIGKLKYIRLKKNSGPSTARNIGIANAMREGSHLFQILDSDDQMYPNKVSELIKPILLDPERIAVAYGDYNIVNEQGLAHYESKPVYDYMRFFGGDCHIHSGALWNGLALKSLYPNFYPEDQRVCEDYFMARCVLRSTQWLAYHVAKPLTLVRSHSNDSTSSVSKEIWERDYRKTMMNS